MRVSCGRLARRTCTLHDPGVGRWPAVVLAVVRDGEDYVDAFVEHYRSLGIRDIVFLDNGSIDGTVQRAVAAGTTVVRCVSPFRRWETTMKQYLVRRYGGGRWCLLVDIDEFFHYPGEDEGLTLGSFLDYLDVQGYDAVVTQMLDLCPAVPPPPGHDDLREHRVYDLSEVLRVDYASFVDEHGLRSIVSPGSGLNFHLNGLRAAAFGIPKLWITKHALFRGGTRSWLSDPHIVRRGRIADVSCALYHYKFTSGFMQRAATAVAERRYGWSADREYRAYIERIGPDGGAGTVAPPGARRLDSVNQLVEGGFVVTSPEFQSWVASHT